MALEKSPGLICRAAPLHFSLSVALELYMVNELKKRNVVIDIAKGISIILVVIGHSPVLVRMIPLNNFLTSFRLPFFFFVSGVFFNYSKPFGRVLADKADALLKPYLVTLLLYGIIEVARHQADPGGYLFGILYGTSHLLPLRWRPLWFLPHLFSVILFSWVFVRITQIRRRTLYARILLLFGLLGAGVLILHPATAFPIRILAHSYREAGLPLSIDLVPLTGFYFLSGFLLRDFLLQFSIRREILILAVAIVAVIQYSTRASMDLNLRRYDNLFLSTVNAFAMIYLVLSLAAVLARIRLVRPALSRVGSKSLFVLIFHFIIMQHTAHRLQGANPALSVPAGILAILAGVALPVLLGEFVSRNTWLSLMFLPFKANPWILKKTTGAPREESG